MSLKNQESADKSEDCPVATERRILRINRTGQSKNLSTQNMINEAA
jgi:hypothetical protein